MMLENTETGGVRALKAHLAINVRNVAESLAFYRKLWGVEPSKVRPGYAKFDVQNPPLNFTLNEGTFRERGALSHLGIQVSATADVLATRERWTKEGLITREEMQTSCCYALQDKAWVRDPDGNEWEVFVVLEDNLPATAACECGDKVTAVASEGERPEVESDANTATAVTAQTVSCCAPAPVGIGK
jgi:catechol 2,3-dioxygenase-like lactoylglutathione lyase family enzyme